MTLEQDPILGLTGRDLGNGWTVDKLLKAGPIGSGGFFSICYLAKKADGTVGFLKSFDFRSANSAPDFMRALQDMTTSYNFERDLLELCRKWNIKRVVTAMESGIIDVEGVPLNKIYYIIFEMADGDARQQMTLVNRMNFVWIYSALHQVSSGLRSLHANLVFHQDLKPSNVLVFDGGDENKISDLGRSHCGSLRSPHDDLQIPGFIPYAPPEQLYGYEIPDAGNRRASADLYQLGSLLFFFFTGVMATPALLGRLAPGHKPHGRSAWTGSYEDVLPYLENSFAQLVSVLEGALRDQIPSPQWERFIPQTLRLFTMLAAVQPEIRGHPLAMGKKHGRRHDLERIISEFDHLAKKAELIDRLNAKAA